MIGAYVSTAWRPDQAPLCDAHPDMPEDRRYKPLCRCGAPWPRGVGKFETQIHCGPGISAVIVLASPRLMQAVPTELIAVDIVPENEIAGLMVLARTKVPWLDA
jgi:hypothetical protein